jgi:hypothetical protein
MPALQPARLPLRGPQCTRNCAGPEESRKGKVESRKGGTNTADLDAAPDGGAGRECAALAAAISDEGCARIAQQRKL